jgi:hypothetical protein
MQPVEFCSDVFLLPYGGVPQVDSIDLDNNCYINRGADVGGRTYQPPAPSPRSPQLGLGALRDKTYYEMLVNRLEFNNNQYVHGVLNRNDHKGGGGDVGHANVSVSATSHTQYARLLPPRVPPKPLPPVRRNLLEPIYESRESEQFI